MWRNTDVKTDLELITKLQQILLQSDQQHETNCKLQKYPIQKSTTNGSRLKIIFFGKVFNSDYCVDTAATI